MVGLLLGKAAEASERGIELVVAPNTWLSDAPERIQTLTTVVGNLIDNAFAALAATPAPRQVVVEIIEEPTAITVTVSDNGPGVPRGAERLIFQEGYSTKPDSNERRGGLGLALVRRLVTRLDGSVTVTEGPGARFTVALPKESEATAVTPGRF
jgi:two-component system CitB family sensor kinase